MDLIPLNKAANEILIRLLGPTAGELGEVFGNLIGLAGDYVRTARCENLRRILERAAAKSSGAPHRSSIPLNVAMPLLEAASLCGDEGNFREYWASLLACAADGNLEQTSHIHILSEMSSVDAALFDMISRVWDREDEFRQKLSGLQGDRIESFALEQNLDAIDVRREDRGYRCAELRLTVEEPLGTEVVETLENLQRLYLIRAKFPQRKGRVILLEATFCFAGGLGVGPTTLGRSFWSKLRYDARR